MKPQLIITQITKVKNYFEPAHTIDFANIPAKLGYTLEIQVVGNGSFNKYLLSNNTINHDTLLMDILSGKLAIVGTDNMK